MARYKYDSVHEWFHAWITTLTEEGNTRHLANIARDLADKTDADTIQDLFESAMDADEFFKDLDRVECVDCGRSLKQEDAHLRDEEWYCTDCALNLQDTDA